MRTTYRGAAAPLLALCLANAAGCLEIDLDGDSPGGGSSDAVAMRHEATSGASDRSGRAFVEVQVKEGETSMILTATPHRDNQLVYIDSVTAPDGEVVYDGEWWWSQDTSVSNANMPDVAASLNWPVISDHGPLQSGKWTVEIGVVDTDYYYVSDAGVDLEASFKRDGDFRSGEVTVNVVYTGATGDDREYTQAIERAMDIWRPIYARLGVTLKFTTSRYQDGHLTAPGYGDFEDYEDLSAASPDGAVNLVVMETISGFEGYTLFGISGGLPGPVVPTGLSGVAVDMINNAGGDGVYSDADVQMLAETMAHEVGHYIGLFHVVETTFSDWDAVSDTPKCSSAGRCESQLGDNLMFPYPICDRDSCVQQTSLTDGQGEIAHRYVGAL
jgi:hypothetical protein